MKPRLSTLKESVVGIALMLAVYGIVVRNRDGWVLLFFAGLLLVSLLLSDKPSAVPEQYHIGK